MHIALNSVADQEIIGLGLTPEEAVAAVHNKLDELGVPGDDRHVIVSLVVKPGQAVDAADFEK